MTRTITIYLGDFRDLLSGVTLESSVEVLKNLTLTRVTYCLS